MAPAAQGGGEKRDTASELALLSANITALKTEVNSHVNELKSANREVTDHLSRQDQAMTQLANTQQELGQAQKILLETITGGLKPQNGMLMKLERVTEWMESSKGNQKWIIRTAVGALISGVALSAGALLLALMHLQPVKP